MEEIMKRFGHKVAGRTSDSPRYVAPTPKPANESPKRPVEYDDDGVSDLVDTVVSVGVGMAIYSFLFGE